MVRRMQVPLEYIILFEELMKITSKITFNTVSQEIKQQLITVTNNIIEDIRFVLGYGSMNEYNTEESQGKKLMILSKFQSHQRRLNSLVEQQSIRKTCSKCERVFPRTHAYFYRNCNAKDGFRNDCKKCHKTKQKELYEQKRKESITPIKEEDLISEEYENIVQE